MKNLFVDMDGTTAQFYEEENCLERMFETGYFSNLKPYESCVAAINELAKNENVKITVLSACITPQSRIEKAEWCEKYFGKQIGTMFCDVGVSKAEHVEKVFGRKLTKDDFLLDDYSMLLADWEQHGGSGIKFRNEINGRGTNGTNYKGPQVFYNSTREELVYDILEITGITEPIDVAAHLLKEINKLMATKSGWERVSDGWRKPYNIDCFFTDEELESIFLDGDPAGAAYSMIDTKYGAVISDERYNIAESIREDLYQLGGLFAKYPYKHEFKNKDVERAFTEFDGNYYWDLDLSQLYDSMADQVVNVNIYLNRDQICEDHKVNHPIFWLTKEYGVDMNDLLVSMSDYSTFMNAVTSFELAAEKIVSCKGNCINVASGALLAEVNRVRDELYQSFAGTVVRELNSAHTNEDIVFLRQMRLGDLFKLITSCLSFTSVSEALVIPKDTVCGLYNPVNGTGGECGFRLPKDLEIPLTEIKRILPDCVDAAEAHRPISKLGTVNDSCWHAGTLKIVPRNDIAE